MHKKKQPDPHSGEKEPSHKTARHAADSPAAAAAGLTAAGPWGGAPPGHLHKPQAQALVSAMAQAHGNRRVQKIIASALRRPGLFPQPAVQEPPVAATSATSAALVRSAPDSTLQRQEQEGKKEDFDYYEDVVPQIIAIAEQRGITFEKAAFVVAQAIAEQGYRDPSKHQFRIFNMQLTWNEVQAMRKSGAQELQKGVRVEWLSSPEYVDGKYVVKKSPFFVYDDLETSINHYFQRLDERHKKAAEVLSQPDATILDFARKLKQTGYATEKDYAKKVQSAYKRVLGELRQWLTKRIASEGKVLSGLSANLVKAWDELNAWKRKYHDETDPDKKRIAQAMISHFEDVLSQLEDLMKKRKAQIKKLKDMRSSLKKNP